MFDARLRRVGVVWLPDPRRLGLPGLTTVGLAYWQTQLNLDQTLLLNPRHLGLTWLLFLLLLLLLFLFFVLLILLLLLVLLV